MRFRKALNYGWRSTSTYEMELGARWYYINRDNIAFKGPAELIRNLLNCALDGMVCHVKAVYSREKHQLTVEL